MIQDAPEKERKTDPACSSEEGCMKAQISAKDKGERPMRIHGQIKTAQEVW